MERKQAREAKKKDNAPKLCSRCRRDTVAYEVISRRRGGELVLCRECVRKGL